MKKLSTLQIALGLSTGDLRTIIGNANVNQAKGSFDGPARAIRAAQAMREAANRLGIDVRLGLHAGEIEITAKKRS